MFLECILLGFSQGGMMAFEFGNYFQKALGGIAIFSGRIMNETKINNKYLKKTPIFISHGNQDDILNIDNFYNEINLIINELEAIDNVIRIIDEVI